MEFKKTVSAITVLLFTGIAYHYVKANKPDKSWGSSIPPVGLTDTLVYDAVPNKATAIKIAEAIWLPLYGANIYTERPFRAQLKDSSVWIVQGTLAKGLKGGTAYIEIQKRDCRILKVTHYK